MEILLKPHSRHDFKEELKDLRTKLQNKGHKTKVEYPLPQQGYGVIFPEVLTIVIDVAVQGVEAIGSVMTVYEIVKAVVQWVRKRKKGRPASVTIRDRDGNILGQVETEPDGKVSNITLNIPANTSNKPPTKRKGKRRGVKSKKRH